MWSLIKSTIILSFLSWVSSEYFTLDVAILKYKALKYQDMENLEHLYYTFDICLCSANYTGYLPHISPDCQCIYQQRGRKVIESIPQAVFSVSCVHSYIPGKCLGARFTGTALGTKIFVKVMIGKTILTYPSWQTLVYSRYKTVSTLKTVAGDDMRITYISVIRRMIGDNPVWITSPITTTSAPWSRPQPTETALDVEPFQLSAFTKEIFDLIRQDINKKKAWPVKNVDKWLSSESDDLKQQDFTKSFTKMTPWVQPTTFSQKSTKISTTTPITTVAPATITLPSTATPSSKTALSTLTSKTTTVKLTTTPSWTAQIATTTNKPVRKSQALDSHNPYNLADVANIRNVWDVTNFLLKRSLIDKLNPLEYDVQTVKDNLVFYHNLYREQHDASEVRENSYLDSLAQRYADRLARMKSCLVHEQPRTYGENLFVYGSQYFPDPVTFARAVTQSFYMEGYSYNYNLWYPQSYHKTGHFTQLVWRESRQIGIGISIAKTDGRDHGACFPRSPAYMIYVCVKYDPAGNFETSEAYKRNVLPLKRF